MKITRVRFSCQMPLFHEGKVSGDVYTMKDVVDYILEQVSEGKDLETAIRFMQSGNIGDAADLQYYIDVAPLRKKNGIIYGLSLTNEANYDIGESDRCEFSWGCSVEVPEFKRISRRENREKRRHERANRKVVCRRA